MMNLEISGILFQNIFIQISWLQSASKFPTSLNTCQMFETILNLILLLHMSQKSQVLK